MKNVRRKRDFMVFLVYLEKNLLNIHELNLLLEGLKYNLPNVSQ